MSIQKLRKENIVNPDMGQSIDSGMAGSSVQHDSGMIVPAVFQDAQSSACRVTRVDFFRRMPTGGGTAYFKPTHAED